MKRAPAVALAVAVAALLLWLARSRDGSPPNDRPAAPATSPAPDAPRAARDEPAGAPDATAPLARTVHDRAVRDAVRRQIFLAWSRAGNDTTAIAPSAAPQAPDPLHAPMPTLDGGAVDPDYLRARIREDFLPMAQQCYAQWEHRAADAGGAPAGRVVTDFVIVGDEHVGGVVDEVTLDSGERDAGADAAVFGDGDFQTCLRESMMAMAFQPPPESGRLRVTYPFTFRPDDAGREAP